MTSDRPYRRALPWAAARREIVRSPAASSTRRSWTRSAPASVRLRRDPPRARRRLRSADSRSTPPRSAGSRSAEPVWCQRTILPLHDAEDRRSRAGPGRRSGCAGGRRARKVARRGLARGSSIETMRPGTGQRGVPRTASGVGAQASGLARAWTISAPGAKRSAACSLSSAVQRLAPGADDALGRRRAGAAGGEENDRGGQAGEPDPHARQRVVRSSGGQTGTDDTGSNQRETIRIGRSAAARRPSGTPRRGAWPGRPLRSGARPRRCARSPGRRPPAIVAV